MSIFPSRPIFTGLALVVLPFALGCARIETDASCQDPNRNRPEQQVVATAMERAAFRSIPNGFSARRSFPAWRTSR